MARSAGETRTEDTEDTEVTEVHGNTLRDPLKARRFTDVGEASRFPKFRSAGLSSEGNTLSDGRFGKS
jgi:hypothetical protein